MKEKMAGFFRKLWKEESGASHIVEIIVVIVVVIALASLLLTNLKGSIGKSTDELDKFITETSAISFEVSDVI